MFLEYFSSSGKPTIISGTMLDRKTMESCLRGLVMFFPKIISIIEVLAIGERQSGMFLPKQTATNNF